MGAEHVVGITANVLVVVVSVNEAAQTCGVRVVDDNMVPITAAVTLPMAQVDVVGFPLQVNDVLEEISTQRTTVVRFIDPTDPSKFSPSPTGLPLWSSLGWKKIGTAVIA